MDNKEKKELTLKQRSSLYFHKSKQYFKNQWYIAKKKIKKFLDSFYFYLIIFLFFLFFLHKALLISDITITEDSLRSLAFAVASIIGASIAIVFLFSTLILQSTADLFSTQYLNKFIQDVKEKVFFWLLVFLTIASFFTPIFLKNYILEILIGILFISFYLIYSLYKELRKRINPETTLTKIRVCAIFSVKVD